MRIIAEVHFIWKQVSVTFYKSGIPLDRVYLQMRKFTKKVCYGWCGRNVIRYARRRRLTIYDDCYVIKTGGDERVGIRRNLRVRMHQILNCSEVAYYW